MVSGGKLNSINILEYVIFLGVVVPSCYGNQTALLDKLFEEYLVEVRPICGADATIEVKVGIAIRQVIELDEPKQILTVNAWLRLRWYDCALQWNPSEYDNITTLILPYSKIWTPDITLYDNAGDELVGLKDYRPFINSDGSVGYNFPTVINSLCRVDVTYFPFDVQKCALPFGSWAFHGLQLNITSLAAEGDIANFKTNSEWDLVRVPVERHVIYYGCCPEPYPDVTFYVILRRKPLFYLLNLLFPCILISTVALLGFMLPPDSGEKVSLEITVLLSLAVFLLVVSETLPPTSENFPYIGIYFCLAMILVTFSTVLSVIVLNVHFKGQLGYTVPRWVRRLFLGTFARLLCVRHEGLVHPISPMVNGNTNRTDLILQDHMKKYTEFDDQDELGKTTQNGVGENGVGHYGPPSLLEKTLHDVQYEQEQQQHSSRLRGVLYEQLAVLKNIDCRFAEKHKTENMEDEWKTVAIVMDRMFLVLFFLLSVVCTLGILLQCVNRE